MPTPSPILSADMHAPVVDATLTTAAAMLGMEVVFIASLDERDFAFVRVQGSMPGVVEGAMRPRHETMCDRVARIGPFTTCDAPNAPGFGHLQAIVELNIRSYAGVPIHAGDDVVGSLCGVDRESVEVSPDSIR